MPISAADFLTEIRKLLGSALLPQVHQSMQTFKLFEVFVFALVREAARREGACIRLLDENGNPVSHYLFRSSPGTLGRPQRNFTHAEIWFPGTEPLEAHVAVKVTGRAEVDHECDVVVLTQSEADLARRDRGSPGYRKALLHIECKYYNGSIDISEGRGFLGLQVDLSKPVGFFVMNRQAQSVETLIQTHRRVATPRVRPGNNDDVERLIGYLRQPFQRYATTGKV